MYVIYHRDSTIQDEKAVLQKESQELSLAADKYYTPIYIHTYIHAYIIKIKLNIHNTYIIKS